MPLYGWLLDPKRCIECRACEVACKQYNSVDVGLNLRYRRVRVLESGTFPQVRSLAYSLACNHCETPYCVKVCPVKAIGFSPTGAVVIDQEKCLGCRECEQFCPYGAPQFNVRTKKMEKCNMCVQRVDQDLLPACATLCPTGALQFGKWDELSKKGDVSFAGFTNPAGTRPRVRFLSAGWGQ